MGNTGVKISIKIVGLEKRANSGIEIPIAFRTDLQGRPRVIFRKILDDFVKKGFISPYDALVDVLTFQTSLPDLINPTIERKIIKERIEKELKRARSNGN